jgi:hypothetical protein
MERHMPSTNDFPSGLPPVRPPSGRSIVQFFAIPGLIIAVAVMIVVGFSYLVSGPRSTDYFLRQLDSTNADIRWRGAHDLAQVLKRPESLALASDPEFALELAVRLRQALDDLQEDEKTTWERIKTLSESEQALKWRKLAPQRDYVLYLTACLGDFTVPVGAPILCEIAQEERSPDVKEWTLRRQRAVWALGNLGENCKRYGQLKKEQQADALAKLKEEAENGDGPSRRREWAKAALDAIGKDQAALKVDATLAKVAQADDPYLRSLVALALNFWDGPRTEPTLLRLANDRGQGELIKITENDGHE